MYSLDNTIHFIIMSTKNNNKLLTIKTILINNMKINKLKEPGIYDRKAFDIAYIIREGLPVTEEERQYFRNN